MRRPRQRRGTPCERCQSGVEAGQVGGEHGSSCFPATAYLPARPREPPRAARVRTGIGLVGASNNAAGATRNAPASASSASNVGFAAPVSTRDRYVLKKPVFSARSSCVMPRAARSSLIRRPSSIRGGRRFTQQYLIAYTNSYTHSFVHTSSNMRPPCILSCKSACQRPTSVLRFASCHPDSLPIAAPRPRSYRLVGAVGARRVDESHASLRFFFPHHRPRTRRGLVVSGSL